MPTSFPQWILQCKLVGSNANKIIYMDLLANSGETSMGSLVVLDPNNLKKKPCVFVCILYLTSITTKAN